MYITHKYTYQWPTTYIQRQKPPEKGLVSLMGGQLVLLLDGRPQRMVGVEILNSHGDSPSDWLVLEGILQVYVGPFWLHWLESVFQRLIAFRLIGFSGLFSGFCGSYWMHRLEYASRKFTTVIHYPDCVYVFTCMALYFNHNELFPVIVAIYQYIQFIYILMTELHHTRQCCRLSWIARGSPTWLARCPARYFRLCFWGWVRGDIGRCT